MTNPTKERKHRIQAMVYLVINIRRGKCTTLLNANNHMPVHLLLRNAFKGFSDSIMLRILGVKSYKECKQWLSCD